MRLVAEPDPFVAMVLAAAAAQDRRIEREGSVITPRVPPQDHLNRFARMDPELHRAVSAMGGRACPPEPPLGASLTMAGGHYNSERAHPLPPPGRIPKACVGGRRDLQSSPAAECNSRTSACADRTSARLVRGCWLPGWSSVPANFSAEDGNPQLVEASTPEQTCARARVRSRTLPQLLSRGEAFSHLIQNVRLSLHRPARSCAVHPSRGHQ